jgi:ABC-type dipeptide/oligopeptide/nickel transport system permease component
MVNKKGNIMLGIVSGIFIFLIGMILINFFKTDIGLLRGSDYLDCSGNISSGTKLVCLLFDMTIPYFIISIISIAATYIILRLTP